VLAAFLWKPSKLNSLMANNINKLKQAIPTDNPNMLMNASVFCLVKLRRAILK
jgi:hypothetical protein